MTTQTVSSRSMYAAPPSSWVSAACTSSGTNTEASTPPMSM